MLLVAICIGCGGVGPGPQTSAKKDSAGRAGTGDGASTGSPESNPKFEVSIEDIRGGCRVCNITFSGKLPSPATVDKIVRESLEKAVLKDPSKDILATAFGGHDTLTSNQYSGSLFYKAADKKILTEDEWLGVKTSASSTDSYYVEIREQGTLPGIKPPKKWLTLTIVYPKTPTQDVAYNAIIAEIDKVVGKGLDVNAYVSVGDRSVKTSWQQMRDRDGAYVFAQYDSATGKITRKNKVLKALR